MAELSSETSVQNEELTKALQEKAALFFAHYSALFLWFYIFLLPLQVAKPLQTTPLITQLRQIGGGQIADLQHIKIKLKLKPYEKFS